MQMPRNLSLPLRTRVLLLLVLRVLSISAIARATVERDGISSITRRGESKGISNVLESRALFVLFGICGIFFDGRTRSIGAIIIITDGRMKRRILETVRTFDTPQSSNPTTSISNQRFTRAPSNRVPFSPSDVESRVR